MKIKLFYFIIIVFCFYSSAYAESSIKASNGIIWDKKNQIYSATGNAEFTNNEIKAYANLIEAKYMIKDGKEVFETVNLNENVKIFYNDEIFYSDRGVYNRSKSLITLTGNVSIESPSRFLSGDELVVDLNNSTRVLKTTGQQDMVEALIKDE
tara:strand:- start:894 stop:1352 length:459 start_codon:yes stop_codon:yes gene_type:complete